MKCQACNGHGEWEHPHNGDWKRCTACTGTGERLAPHEHRRPGAASHTKEGTTDFTVSLDHVIGQAQKVAKFQLLAVAKKLKWAAYYSELTKLTKLKQQFITEFDTHLKE